jgi:hypothetical protein
LCGIRRQKKKKQEISHAQAIVNLCSMPLAYANLLMNTAAGGKKEKTT